MVSGDKDTGIASVVKMKCGRGYEKVGGSTRRVCQVTLTWTGKDIVCKALECSKLVIKNAVANTTSRTFGTVVGFSCNHGTSRTTRDLGNATRRCMANQTWSGSDITCLPPQCPELPSSTIANTSDRSIGVVVKLSCARGMINATGDQQITCSQDQKWKGKILICKKAMCKPLTPVPHSTKNKQERKVGAIVKLTCKKGYKGEGNAYVFCNKKRQWTKLRLNCTKIADKKLRNHRTKEKRKKKNVCKRLSPYECRKQGALKWTRTIEGETVIIMKCMDGWVKLSGQEKRVCRKVGRQVTWTEAPLRCKPGADVADGKPTYQRSTLGPYKYSANHAYYNTCFLTDRSEAPWWFVDLKVEYPIASIMMVKTRGLYYKLARNLKDFTISVTNAKPGTGTYKANKEETCLHVPRAKKRTVVVYKCKSVKVGRYVVISMTKKKQFVLSSIATLKQASQSSTYENYSARLAVDGDISADAKSNTCSITNYQNNPWWVVDLKISTTVSRVILHHRSDRTVVPGGQLANFTVSVTDYKPSGEPYQPAEEDACYSQNEAVVPGSATSIQCKSTMKRRFIVVSRAGVGVMSLCEVLVY
ncbi:uncharacterized protein LOC135488260 [Lineus longissimus]|uniref:uncharacterized protein LOC135488260 n=1 Tax=Lineus longissimus TaxID=88925 RepID=UPI00315DBA7D